MEGDLGQLGELQQSHRDEAVRAAAEALVRRAGRLRVERNKNVRYRLSEYYLAPSFLQRLFSSSGPAWRIQVLTDERESQSAVRFIRAVEGGAP